MTKHVYSNDTKTITVTFDGSLTIAEVTSTTNKVTAKGYARHMPEDTYDRKFGENLAVYRALYRYYRKMAKKLASSAK